MPDSNVRTDPWWQQFIDAGQPGGDFQSWKYGQQSTAGFGGLPYQSAQPPPAQSGIGGLQLTPGGGFQAFGNLYGGGSQFTPGGGFNAFGNLYGGGGMSPGLAATGSGSRTPFGSGSRTTITPAPGVSSPNDQFPYQTLAQNLNPFMAQQAQNQYIANLPNYQGMIGQRSANTTSQLRGEVPRDVITQLLQGAAERGIATGNPGSPNANAAYLRALGLTSIGQQEAGSKNLSQSIADTPVSPLFNPASLIVPELLGLQGLGAAQAGLNRGGGGSPAGGGGYSGPFGPSALTGNDARFGVGRTLNSPSPGQQVGTPSPGNWLGPANSYDWQSALDEVLYPGNGYDNYYDDLVNDFATTPFPSDYSPFGGIDYFSDQSGNFDF